MRNTYTSNIIRTFFCSTFDGNGVGIHVIQSNPNQAGTIEIHDASASHNNRTGVYAKNRGVNLSLKNVTVIDNDVIHEHFGGIYIISYGGKVHIEGADVRENEEYGVVLLGNEGASFTVNNTNSTDNGSIGILLHNTLADAKFDVDLTRSVNNKSVGIMINCFHSSASLKDVDVTPNLDGMYVYINREGHVDLALDGEIAANNNTIGGIIVHGPNGSADIYINGHVTTNSNDKVGFHVMNNTEANLILSSGASFMACNNPIDIENLGSGKFLAKSYPFPPLTCNDCPLEPEDVSLAAVGSTENTATESKVLQGDLDLELEVEIGEVREESRGGSTIQGLFN